MKARYDLLSLVLLLVLVAGCTQPVGDQGVDLAEDYLKKYFSEEYISENFEITKKGYSLKDDTNCYTYKIKVEDKFIEPVGAHMCFNGRKPSRFPSGYDGPKKEFNLQITQEEAERIMQENDCTLRTLKDDMAPFYTRNNDFWWSGRGKLHRVVVCIVDAESGEFTHGNSMV